ncbi:YolD-like family protein [Bacillus paralicheniformis]|uniref:YolD-like family protein n=1 Tax=Bacillus paralicheniformis TaxID=1648923 RepID=UPI000AFEA02D|nr:YolD-like family protein [Bacillus paralicheniformis]
MTLRDRGTMKWTSIFLPEHIAQLRRLKSEIDHAYERKPSIDPEQWSDFESKIQYAYRTGQDTVQGDRLGCVGGRVKIEQCSGSSYCGV